MSEEYSAMELVPLTENSKNEEELRSEAEVLELISQPNKWQRPEQLARIETFLGMNLGLLSEDFKSELIARFLAHESEWSQQIARQHKEWQQMDEEQKKDKEMKPILSMDDFKALREHFENISAMLVSESLAMRLGGEAGATALDLDIRAALQTGDYSQLDGIRVSWVKENRPNIFGQSLLHFILRQPEEQQLALFRNKALLGLMQKDDRGAVIVSALREGMLSRRLEASNNDDNPILTTVPASAA